MKQIYVTLGAAALTGCAAAGQIETAGAAKVVPMSAAVADPYPSTYRATNSVRTAITGATVMTGTGAEIVNGTILVDSGKIFAVGADISVPDGYQVIDGRGKWVTPGVIDAHSHLGALSQPDGEGAQNDVNEITDPNTAQVWVEHSIWPQDPGFDAAREAGVTTLMVLPGSGNLFGGRTVTLKNVPAVTVQGMKFPDAPQGLKIACGENPKSVYGGRGRAPATRMGNVAGFRKAWIDAQDYARRWDKWEKAGRTGESPKRDLQLDTLAGVLRGDILVHNHCYRADDLANMIDVAHEFSFKIRAFHHAVEAYKIAPLLVANDICVATWASWWGFKMEVYDAIEENAALIHSNSGCAIIHSDDPIGIQRLNQEAAAALSAARRAGMPIPKSEAVRWFTSNPAKALGISDRVGTIENGKNADIVLWSHDPFSIYARAVKVWIDGQMVFDRSSTSHEKHSDFLLGQPGQDE